MESNNQFDWLEFGNMLLARAELNKPGVAFISEQQSFSDAGLDSLDSLVFCIFAAGVFCVPKDCQKDMEIESLEELRAFVQKFGTVEYACPTDAIKSIK